MPLHLVTPRYRATIEWLLSRLQPHECDAEEYELAMELQALPLGPDLFSLKFITAEGESIYVDFEPFQVTRFSCPEKLFRFIIVSLDRYPALGALVPERPADGKICPECQGTKQARNAILPRYDESTHCWTCWGLGWVPAGCI